MMFLGEHIFRLGIWCFREHVVSMPTFVPTQLDSCQSIPVPRFLFLALPCLYSPEQTQIKNLSICVCPASDTRLISCNFPQQFFLTRKSFLIQRNKTVTFNIHISTQHSSIKRYIFLWRELNQRIAQSQSRTNSWCSFTTGKEGGQKTYKYKHLQV